MQNKGDEEQQEKCRRILGRRWSLERRWRGTRGEDEGGEKKTKEDEMGSFADGSTCHSIPSGALGADKPDS